MSTLAEQLVGVVAEGNQKLGSNLQSGAALAQSVQQVQQNREKIELEKQQHQLMKVDKLTSAMEAGAKMKSKSARNAFFKNYIPSMQQALGLQDFIPADTMKMIEADPEEAKKFSLLKTKIMNGDMTYDQAVAQMDPEAWAVMDDNEVLQLEASEKFRIQQQEMNQRAQNPQGRLAEQFDVTQMQKVKAAFDQNTRKDMERYTAANNALALLGTNQPISDEAVKTQLARLAGEVGNLTEADLSRFGGSRDLIERSKQLSQTLATGKLTEGNKKQLGVIANEFKKIVEAKIRAQAKRSAVGAKEIKLDQKSVERFLDVDTLLEGGNVDVPSNMKTYKVAGKERTAEQIKEVLKKNPAHRVHVPADILKELGL